MTRMPRMVFASWLPLLAAAVAALPATAHAAWNPAPENGGVPVAALLNIQDNVVAVADGFGGTLLAWEDGRSGTFAIYAQRLSPNGTPMWAANGVKATSLTSAERFARIAPDGTGGAIIGWQDTRNVTSEDIYAQRLDANGGRKWGANGVAVCTFINDQEDVQVVSDGKGGAILSWNDMGAGNRDLYARRVSADGVALWFPDGNSICVAPNSQYSHQMIPDGLGGAIIAWQDERTGTGDIYVQQVDSLGTTHMGATGTALTTAAGVQQLPAMVDDGAGGAIVAWTDINVLAGEVLAQRVHPINGVLWTAGGINLSGNLATSQRDVSVCSDGAGGAFVFWEENSTDLSGVRVAAAGYATSAVFNVSSTTGVQQSIDSIEDGAGGAYLAWTDSRFGVSNNDIFAQRFSASGTPRWTVNGIPVSTAFSHQSGPALAAAEFGAVVAWADNRGSLADDIYAQRIDRFGQLGDPGPALRGVADVAGDQGGQVKLSWDASYLDLEPYLQVAIYWALRSVPESAALKAAGSGARMVHSPLEEIGPGRTILAEAGESQTTYWEYIGFVPAFSSEAYSFVVPTTTDSVAGFNPLTWFRVQARNAAGTQFWFSNPDSGYSVDDLSPAAPAPFTGVYAGSGNQLAWGANGEADLAGYRLYRGFTPTFTPGAGNLVAGLATTTFADPGGQFYSYYKLSAVDAHGNESPFAVLVPPATTAVDDAGLPRTVSFAGAAPNPMRNAGVFQFALPRATHARLEIFGVDGRLVRRLVDGLEPAGTRRVRWDGRDANGRELANGLYFARFTADGADITRRVVTAR